MPKLTFRGAYVRYFDTRQAPKGESLFVRLYCSADLTGKLREDLEWNDLPDGYKGGNLDQEQIAVESVTMKSKTGLGLEFTVAARHMKDFIVVRRKEENKNTSHLEVDFTVVTDEKGAYTTVGDFIATAGKGKGTLLVTYREQASLIPEDVTAPDQQRTLVEE